MNIDISFVALACHDAAIVVAGKMESWSTNDGYDVNEWHGRHAQVARMAGDIKLLC